MGGTHIFFTLVGMVLPAPGGAKFLPFLAPVCWKHIGAMCGKYGLLSIAFSHRPDKGMSVWTWQELV